MSKPWTLSIDLDGILAKPTSPDKYAVAEPIRENIQKVNRLKRLGHRIVIYTARGWYGYEMTADWLKRYGVEYDQLVMGKLYAHHYVDDLGISLDELVQKMEEKHAKEQQINPKTDN